MRTTSLTLLLALTSSVALVGCESHEHHHRSDTGSYESNRQQMTSDTRYDNSSAVSTGGAAASGVNDNRNTNPNSTDTSDRPRAGAAVQQDADRQGSASGVTDNRNVNRSEGTSSARGTNNAMTPEEKNRTSPQGPSADNGDTGRSAERGTISNRTSDNGNQTGSTDNTVPRAGSGIASDNDSGNVQRSESSATTQPSPRSASDR